ncbi:hypothetical protein [Qipengyuania aquimaris]|uniref:Uncharacterized protein n=1 Tax=Qipengyuania aquimaris TaxID=255984 RepID=A0A9Q3XD38_9SPHN|nr:hypothetical protein [Qipengyuania aquimaris]MBY6217376.1 hypothetical protein [Qipengyuania aquimaris]
MRRQLLALLALLTGLAAVDVPAHAALGGEIGVGFEQSASGASDAREAKCPCEEKQRKQKLRGEKVTPCKKQEPVVIYLPTVQFGADRAYE